MFRIYTEDLTVAHFGVTGSARKETSEQVALRLLAKRGITGATLYHGTGLSNGETERALVIETDGASGADRDAVRCRAAVYSFAYDLKSELSQRTIGIVETAETFTLIGDL